MTDDMSRAFANAMAAAAGDDPLSRLRRASLNAVAAEHPELLPPRPLPLTMHLEDPAMVGQAVPAIEAGAVLERFQRAIARIAKARRTRVAEVKRLNKFDLRDAQLDMFAASPGSLIIELRPHLSPRPGTPQDEIDVGASTWAEAAMVELIRILPLDDEDEAALDAIVVADPVIRRAVTDLVQGRVGGLQVSLSLERPEGGPITGHLSPAQARTLQKELAEPMEDEVRIEFRQGRLDGVRTRRRIFYLEGRDGNEVHGLVDEDRLPDVLALLDQTVEVQLEVVVTRARSGRDALPRYRLVGIRGLGEPSLLPYDEDQVTPELRRVLERLPDPPQLMPPAEPE